MISQEFLAKIPIFEKSFFGRLSSAADAVASARLEAKRGPVSEGGERLFDVHY